MQDTNEITKRNGNFHIRFAVMSEDGRGIEFEKEFQNVDYIQIKTPNGNNIDIRDEIGYGPCLTIRGKI